MPGKVLDDCRAYSLLYDCKVCSRGYMTCFKCWVEHGALNTDIALFGDCMTCKVRWVEHGALNTVVALFGDCMTCTVAVNVCCTVQLWPGSVKNIGK